MSPRLRRVIIAINLTFVWFFTLHFVARRFLVSVSIKDLHGLIPPWRVIRGLLILDSVEYNRQLADELCKVEHSEYGNSGALFTAYQNMPPTYPHVFLDSSEILIPGYLEPSPIFELSRRRCGFEDHVVGRSDPNNPLVFRFNDYTRSEEQYLETIESYEETE